MELMIVVSIAGILMALAIPGFTTTIRNNRLSAQTNEFIYALKFARAEALKRGVPVTVCRSAAQAACDAGGTASWENGWIIFAENEGTLGTLNAAQTIAANTTLTTPIVRAADNRVLSSGTILTAATLTAADTLLVAHEALSGNSTLRGNNVFFPNRITFNSQGMVQAAAQTFFLCDRRGNGASTNLLARADAREIIVAFSGQTRLTTPASRAATTPVTAAPADCAP